MFFSIKSNASIQVVFRASSSESFVVMLEWSQMAYLTFLWHFENLAVANKTNLSSSGKQFESFEVMQVFTDANIPPRGMHSLGIHGLHDSRHPSYRSLLHFPTILKTKERNSIRKSFLTTLKTTSIRWQFIAIFTYILVLKRIVFIKL